MARGIAVAGDDLAPLQLDLYAVACTEVWGKDPADLTLTYLYLGDGSEDRRPAGDPAATKVRVLAALRSMAEGEFQAEPGPYCRWCDFLSFCSPGRSFMKAQEG